MGQPLNQTELLRDQEYDDDDGEEEEDGEEIIVEEARRDLWDTDERDRAPMPPFFRSRETSADTQNTEHPHNDHNLSFGRSSVDRSGFFETQPIANVDKIWQVVGNVSGQAVSFRGETQSITTAAAAETLHNGLQSLHNIMAVLIDKKCWPCTLNEKGPVNC